MGLLDLIAGFLTNISSRYYERFETPKQQGYIVFGGLESVVDNNTRFFTPQSYAHPAGENLDYLEGVIEESKESGLYDRFEQFLEDAYGSAPREHYRIGHDNIDETILAYTDTVSTIGVGPKFKEGAKETAATYGITPSLAAFLTYAHERAHMAQGQHYSTKEAEIDVDSALESFLTQETRNAKAEGDVWQARQYDNARAYQQDRVFLVQNDVIDAYRDAA